MTINLSQTDPRDYLRDIERALCTAGRLAAVAAIHSGRPRDLAELLILLPDDVELRLWEASQ
jgi:hypothetical protein